MTRDEALDKIRKLLNRNGRTDAEADTASILAAALADKHDIDIAEIDRADQARAEITHKIVGEWATVPPEADYAASICNRFFEIHSFETGHWARRMVFVGTEHHLAIAEYVFTFLLGEFRRAWNRRANKRLKLRRQFMEGCFVALYQKLMDRFERPGQLQLALEVSWKSKRESYMAENFGKMKTVPVCSKDKGGIALEHGFRAGQGIEIRPGVNGSAAHNRITEGPKLLTG